MKFTSIFIRKKHINFIIIFLIAFILLFIFLKLFKSTSTFNIVSDSNIIKTDLTGDGIEDILHIKAYKNKYTIQVNTKNKTLYIKPNKNIDTIGHFLNHWPIKVTLLDIDRNNIPEIFIQSCYSNKAIQHIYFWNGTKFEEIFFDSNNILGFIDSNNNKTPKVILGNIDRNYTKFSNYMFNNNKFEDFYCEHSNTFMGKDSIFSLINYIESLPDNKEGVPTNIFYPGLTIKNFYALEKLISDEGKYNFQDALFRDTKWDKNGNVTEIKWILNFKVTPKSTNESNKISTLYLHVFLKPSKDAYNNTNFRITSIEYKLNMN